VPLAKCDATAHSSLATRFSVNGYPTLFMFRNGKEYKYEGPREKEGIVNYMKKQVGPSAKALETKEEVDNFIKSDPVNNFAIVGFFPSPKASQLSSSFVINANKLRDTFIFGKVSNPEVAKLYGIDGEGVIAFKDYDEKGPVTFMGKPKELESWIHGHSFPLVGQYTKGKADIYKKRGLPIAKFYTTSTWADDKKTMTYYYNRLKGAATKYLNKILVATLTSGDFESEVDAVNGKKEKFVLVLEDGEKKYLYEAPKLTGENVIQWLDDFVAKKLEKYVKSEKLPSDNSGPVKVVVGKNFEQIVEDPEKDVLIEFYAPWCGHCKSLAPKYEELGKKLKSVPSVVIAKIDSTANDYDRSRYEVSGFPTIFLVPAGKNVKPIKFEGDREVNAMYNFIKKKAKVKFSKESQKTEL